MILYSNYKYKHIIRVPWIHCNSVCIICPVTYFTLSFVSWQSMRLPLLLALLQERKFATKSNVSRLLDSLDNDTAAKDSLTQLEVTHMADDKLTILVKVCILYICTYLVQLAGLSVMITVTIISHLPFEVVLIRVQSRTCLCAIDAVLKNWRNQIAWVHT